ncbi:hypothetical protein T08_7241 [Trichinella sp. T8]|nr:hypothetical protein T08_7241 [Trichinella sp. T8]
MDRAFLCMSREGSEKTICLHIFLFLCDGNQLSSLLRVQVLFVLCAIVLLTLQRALYALQLMQI